MSFNFCFSSSFIDLSRSDALDLSKSVGEIRAVPSSSFYESNPFKLIFLNFLSSSSLFLTTLSGLTTSSSFCPLLSQYLDIIPLYFYAPDVGRLYSSYPSFGLPFFPNSSKVIICAFYFGLYSPFSIDLLTSSLVFYFR